MMKHTQHTWKHAHDMEYTALTLREPASVVWTATKSSVRNMFFVYYYVIFYTRWNDGKTGLPGQSILNRLPGFRNLE